MNSCRLITIVTLGLLLAGCGGSEFDDLREFTANAHKGRQPRVDPLPTFKPQEAFAYSASDLTDPFSQANLRPLKARSSTARGGQAPDTNRRREPLESYPLDSLAMVGTLTRDKHTWAIVRAPDGTVHHVQVGNYAGENFGKIYSITESKVQITEKVQGSNNDWIEREASLSITD